MNNNLNTERAVRGLFSTASYITIADEYAVKPKPDPRHVGKQFGHEHPHKGMAGGRENRTLFDREHKWLFTGEKYIDVTQYRTTQPPDARKKGFDSSDARRRDEFTQHFPTEQWRERLKGESDYQTKINKQQEDKGTLPKIKVIPPPIDKTWAHGPRFLYDVGREEESGNTPYEKKDARDTWYSRHRSAYASNNPEVGTRYGSLNLSSQSYGYGNDRVRFNRPAFARQPIVRESFFRATGIFSTGRGPVI